VGGQLPLFFSDGQGWVGCDLEIAEGEGKKKNNVRGCHEQASDPPGRKRKGRTETIAAVNWSWDVEADRRRKRKKKKITKGKCARTANLPGWGDF
jgi:hypothetical protein